MYLQEELLYSLGAAEQNYNPGDYIFREGGSPQFYFQIISGNVKLNNYHRDGKEFIQGILTSYDPIGEYMLHSDKMYPMNAVALTRCSVIRVCRKSLLSYLDQSPAFYMDLCKSLSKDLYRKFVLMQKISCHSAVERLKEVLHLMKQEQENTAPFTYEVPITRQQLASLTGLCLETTIRTIKKMEREKIVQIRNRKILF
ncbi:Crp/Fnr family transcriptional regulator [Chryseobacterium fluminis]|uniref:Crp/Fnr family transcriptional regulator n=1 Tax=Chryseobacterium fluminis TaxID=2983606 RepID=UPI0022575B42|nr:Crp/Fnr family transcriptional regulator [Chryseobacterium sp. MMS21-Ot14]UZT99208.1 Crp/Fnr family transcriptional regulator [Chryseobacterium sp. MMS21-Ot14]